MNFGAYITLSAFAPGQCSMDSSGQQKKQVENLQDSFIFLNPRSADFTCVKSKWIYTVQSHRDLCEVSDSNWNAICVSKLLITDNSLKIQCPVQRVHPATLFCTADISEAKIEWENNRKCKTIEFPCWNSVCHWSCQRQVISYSNNQRFSFGHWIEYMTLILDSAWFKRYLHMHFYIYHRAAEMHRFRPNSRIKQ